LLQWQWVIERTASIPKRIPPQAQLPLIIATLSSVAATNETHPPLGAVNGKLRVRMLSPSTDGIPPGHEKDQTTESVMNKQISELKLEDMQDVIGGLQAATSLVVSSYPASATVSVQPAYKLPVAPPATTWAPY
jgi:hypothetical protein